jgi:hypothetical protein
MKAMSLESPTTPAKTLPALVFEEEEAEEVDQVEDLRTRFVGDIEISESTSMVLTIPTHPLIIFYRSRATARRNEATICIVPYSIPRGMHLRVRHCAQANHLPA